ncbi:hypothetical protein FHS19_000085 [Paenibacillus rhizosphaerae]|uniref:Transposase n=1 Tax=Paenibacillus rhizosphaerae TaxID=297318 RepID=A0A839TFF7_9BACL|nr:hypothetical protein [Paenibacillus rhizosphaerae]MBB3125431.1 hypothetical protein [Paenibacillus rhizosphaerae]
MATRVSYPVEVKKKAIEMRLDGIPVKEVMDQDGIAVANGIGWSSLLVNNTATPARVRPLIMPPSNRFIPH